MALKELATKNNKYQSKKDCKHQCSRFRDILCTVEDGNMPRFDVHYGGDRLIIDSWVQRRQYDMFCHALGAGQGHGLTDFALISECPRLEAVLTRPQLWLSDVGWLGLQSVTQSDDDWLKSMPCLWHNWPA